MDILSRELGKYVELDEVDEDMVEYMAEVLESGEAGGDSDALFDMLAPFLEQLAGGEAGNGDAGHDHAGGLTKLDSAVVVSELDEDVLTKGNVMVEGSAEALALSTTAVNKAAVERERANRDAVVKAEAKLAAKAARAAEKAAAAAKAEQAAREAAEAEGLLASHVVLAGRGKLSEREQASRDINIEGFQMAYGGKVLLKDATLRLAFGRRYGLIGQNGVGKSTLLRHIANGDLPLPSSMTKLYVAQEVEGSETTAVEAVLEADTRRAELLATRAAMLASDGTDDAELAGVENALIEIEAESAPARAARILHGLQFSTEMQSRPTSAFSGGWRMRIAIARALFHPPDLLILDEPTNHLDLHACIWLEEFLREWPTTLVVVSHHSSFLDAVCTDIVHQASGKLEYYKGNYSAFVDAAREKRLVHEREYRKQQAEIEHMEKFVTKFRFKAKGSKMAQSRLKKLDKIERLEAPETEAEAKLTFYDPEPLDAALLHFQGVSFGYGLERGERVEDEAGASGAVTQHAAKRLIFDNIEVIVSMDTRVTLVGPNGAGKSTFLKLCSGAEPPTEGYIIKPNKLRIAMFEQHFVDALDLSLSPLEYFKVLHPEVERKELRGYLGRFGLSGELATQVMGTLSGGQKARVVFADVAWTSPHLLLLDEPTNHLDIETITALIDALNAFTGAVIVVTHDPRLIESVCNELWMCEGGKVERFEGGFPEYRKVLMKELGL
ncbi:ATP-dependent transporter [Thecamonas trahens ATCC 50062]|uniref:ATP-dependent transporter n=1 Tax=Thecamonas trahens ATCC 50062 TaxID=461836 RepID=A0A0L0DJB2_THETB|nr:ATP-dependent transporter [Thecamonas trahens ATCC 50062]KNC52494.1 ATP-dependent transporter [Thecamonas trahens ATCC 50062]|eukprot:XP_013755290.1 ATP-dependent transporter [Thecamonas trahens ATCC 50062]